MHSQITFLSHEERNGQVTRSRDSFFPGRVKGAGPGVWGILVPRARRFLVTWSWQIKPRMGSGAENRFCVFEFIIFYQLTWITRRWLQFNNYNYNLTLLREMNFFIALFKLKYSATGGLARHQTEQVCLNIYFLFYSLVYFFTALP